MMREHSALSKGGDGMREEGKGRGVSEIIAGD